MTIFIFSGDERLLFAKDHEAECSFEGRVADLGLLRVFEPTASWRTRATVVHGCILDSRFGFYHAAIVLSFPRNISFTVI